MRRSRATLALGGGGARGLAHLGVIEGLLGADFAIERIVGVSIGSLAGALFAFCPNISQVQKTSLKYLLSPEFQRHQKALTGMRPSSNCGATGGACAWYDRIRDYVRANLLCRQIIRDPSLLPESVLRQVVDHLLPDADIADAYHPHPPEDEGA